MTTTRHPRCDWTELPIIDELPKACPIRSRDSFDVLHAYKDAGWQEIGESACTTFSTGDVRGSLDLLGMVDCCRKCLGGGILKNRNIRRLRAEAIWEAQAR